MAAQSGNSERVNRKMFRSLFFLTEFKQQPNKQTRGGKSVGEIRFIVVVLYIICLKDVIQAQER